MPVSRIWTLKATRSTMAATRRGSGEHRAPFAEGQVGRDRDAGPFFAFGDDLEQQLGAAWVDLDITELVEASVAADHSGQ